MDDHNERRREDRLGYECKVWFSQDFTETMSQGVMVDISGGGIGFVCPPGDTPLSVGQHLTVRFSIPRFQGDDPTATVSMTRTGCIRRVEKGESETYRVSLEFDVPLPLQNAEISSLNSLFAGSQSS